MRITIDNEWVIESDPDCCQLIRLRVITGDSARGRAPKAENIGKTREEGYGFFGTFDQALRAYLFKSVQASPAHATVQEALTFIKQALDKATEAAKAAKGVPR